MAEAALGLGSNLGDRRQHLLGAVRALRAVEGIEVRAVSSLWETQPWGVTDQAAFLNACILVETTLAPLRLLETCLGIEAAQGRERRQRWGPRTLDIDILYYDDVVCAGDTLTLPHPGLTERGFVLAPLAEIAPDRQIAGRTVQELAAHAGMEGLSRLDHSDWKR